MSRTLSANVQNGIANGGRPVLLLEVESSNGIHRWGTISVNNSLFPAWPLNGPNYAGSYLPASPFGLIAEEVELDEGGNVAVQQSWSFKVGNAGLKSDTLLQYNWSNRRVELRLIFIDQTNPSWANAVPLFVGTTARVRPISLTEMVFECTGDWERIHRQLPRLFVDRAQDPAADESLTDVPYGLVYGDFSLGGGINKNGIAYSYLSSNKYSRRDCVTGIFTRSPIGATEASQFAGWMCLAEHELKNRRIAGDADVVYVWNDDINAVTRVDAKHFHGASGIADLYTGYRGIDRQYNGQAGYDRNKLLLPSGTAYEWVDIVPEFEPERSSDYPDVVNGHYAVDEDPDNYCTIVRSSGSRFAWFHTRSYKCRDDYQYHEAVLMVERSGSEAGTYEISRGGTTTTGSLTFGAPQVIDLSAWGGGALKSIISIKITLTSGSEIRIKGVHIRARRELQSLEFLNGGVGQSVKGRFFHKWIASPSHSNGFAPGDLIENPAYVIESILCDELFLRPANVTGAISLDGIYQHLLAGHSDSLAITGDFTISAWVNMDSISGPTGRHAIVSKRTYVASPHPSGYEFGLYNPGGGGRLYCRLGDGASETETGGTAIIGTGSWVHVVVVRTGNAITFYVNGAAEGAFNNQSVSDGGGMLWIGYAANGGAGASFDGKISELKIWSRALDSGEIGSEYNGGNGRFGSAASQLVAAWHFDEGYGVEYRDYSGNHNDLGVRYDPANYAPDWADGKPASVSQIAESDFDDMATLRSAWKLARQLRDTVSGIDLIRSVCYEAGLIQMTRWDGRQTVRRLEATAAAVTTYDRSYFALAGDRSSFVYDPGDPDQVYNEFVLRYRNCYLGDEYATKFVLNSNAGIFDNRFCNLSSEGSTYWTKCRNAYLAHNSVRRWEYEALWIRDGTTAELFLKWIIAWHTRLRSKVKYASGLKLLGIEIGDERKHSHDLMPTAKSGTARYRCTKRTFNPNPSVLRGDYEWIEVDL